MTSPLTFVLLMVTCVTWSRDLIKGNEVNREIRTTFSPSVSEVHSRKPYCKIRCGVISQRRGDTDLRHIVSETWKKLKTMRNLSSIEISFDENEPRHDLSMDSMIKAYIAIGTTNVSAIIGPFVSTVLTATLKFGIPYFLTENTVRHEGSDQESSSRSHYRYSYLDEKPYNLISTRPRLQDLSELARDFIAFSNWSSVAILYAGRSGAELVEKLVQVPKLHVTSWIIPLTSDNKRQSPSPQAPPAPTSDDDDFIGVNDFIGDSLNGVWRDDMVVSASKLRKILLEVRGASFSSIILVDPDGDLPLEVIFNEALKLSMFTSRYEWIYLSFNQPSFDESTYHFSGVVLLTTHLSHNGAGNMLKDFNWKHFSNLEVSTIVDSLLTIYQALVVNHRETGNCSMAGEKRLEELLEKVSVETFSGQLRFNRDGSRTGYIVEIHALVPGGLKQIGLWNSSIPLRESGRLRIDRTLFHLRSDSTGATNDATGSAAGVSQGQDGAITAGKGVGALEKNKRHFTVAMPREFPFAMLRSDHWNRTEMDHYHGYCLDFLRELSRDLSFNYDVTVVSDDLINYCCGSDVGGGGLLATIQNGTASFGLPFPVSSATNKMLDLTIPFSSTEWAVLVTGADQGRSQGLASLHVWFFIFIEPFPPSIWLVLVGAVLVASCCLYVLESMDLLRPLEERMLVTQDVWSGGCIGCHNPNTEIVPTIVQGEGEFGKCQRFVSDSDLTERPSIDYSFDDRFRTHPCCCCYDCKKASASHAVVAIPSEVGTTIAVDSRLTSGGKYVSLSFVQCLWIVITMTTLRDLNSPIRLLHRTAVGRVFSLLLRSFSLVTIVSYASSLVLLSSKLELQNSRHHRDAFLSAVDQISARNTNSKVFLPSKEVENYLFDQEDMEMDGYVRANPTLESTNLAWRRLLASDRISYLKEIIQTQQSNEYNSSVLQQNSFLENLFSSLRPARLKPSTEHSTKPTSDQPSIAVWHLAGLNYISSKLCLEDAGAGGELKVIVRPLMERKHHKQRIHFSIALPQGTSLRNELNAGILRLKEQGILERLERRWELWTAPCSVDSPKDKSDPFIGNANLQMFGGFAAVFCCLWISNVFWAIFRRKRKRCNNFYRTEERVRSVKNENHHPHHASLRLSSHEQSLPQTDTRDVVPGSSPPTFDQSMSFNVVSESTALTATPSTDLTLATASTMPELQESSTSHGLHQRHHHHHHPHHHHHHHRHKQHSRRRDRAAGTNASTQKSKGDSYPTWRRQTNIF